MNPSDMFDQERLAGTIACHAAGGPGSIDRRLSQLNHEWDLERVMMVGGAVMGLFGLVIARRTVRAWLVLPTISLGWLLQHALAGACPISRKLRRLGVREGREIQTERVALKALRGDFRRVPPVIEGRDPSAVGHLLDIITR